MSNPSGALDPSVGEDADTSPAKLGRENEKSATSAEITPPEVARSRP